MTKTIMACLAAGLIALCGNAAEKKIKKQKLQIVFLFGQSNMVGLGDVMTTHYATRPQWVPNKEEALKKAPYFDWGNFYWSGVRYYAGPRKKQLEELLVERRISRNTWRRRIKGRDGIQWDEKAWGKHPGLGRNNVYPFLDKKALEEKIYQRIAEILDGKDNKVNMHAAYEQLKNRDKEIAQDLARVREIYLNGTKDTDYSAFDIALRKRFGNNAIGILEGGKENPCPDAKKIRTDYARLAQKHLKLPIAKRTRIYAHGAVRGAIGKGIESTASGPLSVGFGASFNKIGPEYAVGITLERLVDAPILLVKCSWGNTALAEAWLPPSLSGKDLSWCWKQVMPQIDKVLADPGKFHPEYNSKVGYEVAGMVWFQGYSDMNNPRYGELFAQLIKDLRKKVNTPEMPVVCGTLGHGAYKESAFSNDVNKGLLKVSGMPEFKGTVDVVNTAPFYPIEFDYIKGIKKGPPLVYEWAVGKGGSTHYHGSGKFFLLMGDAVARSLANLMAGGKPTIHASVK